MNKVVEIELPDDDLCQCCLTERLRESSCSIVLPPPRRKVLSGTVFQKNHQHTRKLCDGLVVWMHPHRGYSLAAVEMKGGTLSASKVVEQLQEGARVAEVAITAEKVTFGAVLFKKAGLHPLEIKVLGQRRIVFRTKGYRIFTTRCGASIDDTGPWASSGKTRQRRRSGRV